jgi:hypothetical protein
LSDKVSVVATKRETDEQSAPLEQRLDSETLDNDAHAVATPDTAKGYGYEMKDDDGAIDPLDELLDAYQSFLRAGMVNFADEVMELVHELQSIMVGKSRDYDKGHDMGYGNPVGCLAQAYLGLVMFPDSRELARRVLDIMDRAAQAITGENSEQPAEDSEGDNVAESDMGDSGNSDSHGVRREIRVEREQFCVFSETGRAFGCYASRDEAEERLSQIERFSETVVRSEPLLQLIELHDAAHKVAVVTKEIKTAHDIISDELEVVHELSEPYAIPTTVKEAMMTRLDAGFVSKAIEYRYTLGPAYVPDREDAHGEFTDTETLQKAMWDWVRKGDRTIYLQHSDKAAGEMVEMMTMPFPLEAELTVPNQGVTKYTFPADTPFLGVVWEPWAWELVKSGQLRGYSIGGSAKRVEADLPVEATV